MAAATPAANPFLNQTAPVSAAVNGDNTLVTALAGRSIGVRHVFLQPASAATLTLKSGASTTLGACAVAGTAQPTVWVDDASGGALFATAPGEALVLNTAVAVTGYIDYFIA